MFSISFFRSKYHLQIYHTNSLDLVRDILPGRLEALYHLAVPGDSWDLMSMSPNYQALIHTRFLKDHACSNRRMDVKQRRLTTGLDMNLNENGNWNCNNWALMVPNMAM